MNRKRFIRILSMLLVVFMVAPFAISCNDSTDDTEDTTDSTELTDGSENSESESESNTDESGNSNDSNENSEGNKNSGNEVNKLDITTMSFNIRYLTSDDTGVRAWDARKQAVSAFILEKGAGIVCMQEVKPAQKDFLTTALASKYSLIWYGREAGNTGEGLAIAYDKSQWELVEQNRFWLSETPNEVSKGWGASTYRICVTATLKNIATGAKISVYNVHLDHVSTNARYNGIQLVLDRIALNDYPTYLCGDFNARREEDAYKITAEVMNDSQLTSPVTDSGNTATAWGTSERENDVIDFNFFTKQHFELVSFEICEDKWGENNENYLSDHNSVVSKVKLLYTS